MTYVAVDNGRRDLECCKFDWKVTMKPRTTVLNVILSLGLLAAPVLSDAQQPAKVYRIGYLGVSAPAPNDTTPQHCPIKGSPGWQAFVEGLREHGYLLGQNLILECRSTEGHEERAPALAAELVSLKPDLLVAFGTVQVRAAKQATSTLPILMVGVIDPVRRGLVTSLAHPGANVTGVTHASAELEAKRLQLLTEAVPKVSRVAVLGHPPATPEPNNPLVRQRDAAAQALGCTLQRYDIRNPSEFVEAFTGMARGRAEALFVTADPFWLGHEQRIVDLAAQFRLPAVYHLREFVQAGGLLSYDVDGPAIWRRLGGYVDKILKGANPADLPVEQPTKFELVINIKTAKALGITIPKSLLERADEVIQ